MPAVSVRLRLGRAQGQSHAVDKTSISFHNRKYAGVWFNCHPSKYFARLAAANVNRQVGLDVCRCCSCSSSTPTPLCSKFLSPIFSLTVTSISLPPLLLSLLILIFPASFSSHAEFIFSEVLAILPNRYPLVLHRISSVLL